LGIVGLLVVGLGTLRPVVAQTTVYTGPFSGTIAAGATARLDDGASVSGNVANSGTLQFNMSGSSAVANNAIISGTGVVRMTGSGTVSSLFDAQTYTGRTLLENGTLLINYNDRIGNTSSGVTFDGGRLRITNSGVNSTFSTARAMSLLSAGTIDTSSLANGSYDQPAFTGVVSGTGALTLAANGLGNGASDAYLRFGGASTYTGTTTITSGMVYASNTAAFGTSTVVLDGGGLVAPNAVTVNNAIVLAGTANSVRPWTGDTMNLGGSISGAGGLLKTDNGTVNLNAANTYTGDTRILAGTLNLGHYSALAGTTLDMASGDTGSIGFTVAQTGTYQIGALLGSRNINIGGNTLEIGRNGSGAEYAGVISGAGGVIFAGPSEAAIRGANTYSGGTELAGGVLSLQGTGKLIPGTISFTGGTLRYNAAGSEYDYSSQFSTAAGQNYAIDTNGYDVTYATRLQSSGGSLTKLGAGVLNLTGTTAAPNTVVLDLTTNVSAGGLQAVSGTADLRIGNSGTGTLNVTGGRVTNSIGFLGVWDSGVGNATVSSGTWNNSGNLIVGVSGTGTLSITGGSVTNTHGVLGDDLGSVGTATVSSGTWANSGYLFVGDDGTGTLNVTGGSVTNVECRLGRNAGSIGSATVSSGTWASGNLVVGSAGTGTLNVTGGRVTNSKGLLGFWGSGVGNATVSSGTWNNSDFLSVGQSGTGTLSITGGSVTNTYGVLGNDVRSVGTATVSSGTWANSSDLSVGVGGTGTLTMSGGLVSVGGTLKRGTTGTINLNAGGTLQIGTGGAGGVLGVSTLTNNGTLIFNRSNASTYSGIISGSGAVTKLGAGTLTLSGNNTYTGPTVVTGGVLALQGAGDIAASSGVDLASGAALVVGSASGDRTLQMLTGSAGSFVDVGSRTLTVGNASSGAFAGGIIGSGGGLTKAGSGSLTLSGSNSFTGQTTVSAGTLVLDSGNALAPTAAVVVNSGATLQANQPIRIGYLDSSGTVIGGGNLSSTLTVTRSGNIGGIADGSDSQGTFAAGVVKLGTGTSTVSSPNTYTGLTWVREGTLAVGTANPFAAASSLTVDSGAIYSNAIGSTTVTDVTVNGSILSSGGLLTATGILDGSGAITGDVLTTGVFRGSQTITGDVEVRGIHAPGNSPGIQTITGNLAYTSGGSGPSVVWELTENLTSNSNATVFDQVFVGGDLDFATSTSFSMSFDSAGSTVNWGESFWNTNQQWTVWSVTGTTTGFGSLSLAVSSWLDGSGQAFATLRPGSSFALGLGANGQDVVLNYSVAAVPEPSTMILAGLGISVGFVQRWRAGRKRR
jgi:autotransporter-associated beta strand protein/T5SS/PEP-CTERM-associated repeat protein